MLKVTLWIVMAGLAPHLWSGCSRSVPLKRPRSFSTKQVRLILWEDRCRLQTFFDSNPPENLLLNQRSMSMMIGGGRTRDAGTITYRVQSPVQKRMLRKLLRRYYVKMDWIAAAKSFDVTVGYYRFCGRPRMIRGTQIFIKAGKKKSRLDYHPCMGAFLLNRYVYKKRPMLIAETEALRAQK